MTASELRQKTCCFAGHRDFPVYKTSYIAAQTANQIRSLIINNEVRFFGVGGALGYDTLAAKVLFQLRKNEFPHIKVILVYPFLGFTSHWTAHQRSDFERMLPQYDKVVCVSEKASREAYLARDRHLVDSSAYCITYCTRGYGGTAYTVRYAQRQGLEVRNIV